jgi:hypothetical protein
VLAASLTAVLGWPDQDVAFFDEAGTKLLTKQGAEMLVNMGFAGMGYCPLALATHRNAKQGTLFEWVFGAGSHKESMARAQATLEAYERPGSQFFEYTPTQEIGDSVYGIPGDAVAAIEDQFGSKSNAREKTGFCLTAIMAIASGRPLLAGKPIHCHEDECRAFINTPKHDSNTIYSQAKTLSEVQVVGFPIVQGWPHGPEALHPSAIRVVVSLPWGLQAIVVHARIPVAFSGNHLRMVPGILVTFRGTTSFHITHAVHVFENKPGADLSKEDDMERQATRAAKHQWAMNIRQELTELLVRSVCGSGPEFQGIKTHDGLSHEAAVLVGFPPLKIEVEEEAEEVEEELVSFSGLPFPWENVKKSRVKAHIPRVIKPSDDLYEQGKGEMGGICDAVLELSNGGADALPIMTTGHSKGGALSILGAYLLQQCLVKSGVKPRVTTVMSVEGPRTGDQNWGQHYIQFMTAAASDIEGKDKKKARFNVYRVVKRGDPVPEQPIPQFVGYRHMPGLLVLPVVTALDVNLKAKIPIVSLPPVFVCDLIMFEDLGLSLHLDVERNQLGVLKLSGKDQHPGGDCVDQAYGNIVPADLIVAGWLEGPTCTLCTGSGSPKGCQEQDYSYSESSCMGCSVARCDMDRACSWMDESSSGSTPSLGGSRVLWTDVRSVPRDGQVPALQGRLGASVRGAGQVRLLVPLSRGYVLQDTRSGQRPPLRGQCRCRCDRGGDHSRRACGWPAVQRPPKVCTPLWPWQLTPSALSGLRKRFSRMPWQTMHLRACVFFMECRG